MPYQDPAKRRAHDALHKERIAAENAARRQADIAQYRARDAAHYAANREEILRKKARYNAQNRDKVRAQKKATRERHKATITAYNAAYYAANRAREIARSKQYQAENQERKRTREAAYRAANPEQFSAYGAQRRARLAQAPRNDLTVAQWRAIKEHYGHRCVYCGTKPERLTKDHIIPLTQGGSHTVQNVVPACRSCNSRKRTGPPLTPVQPLLLIDDC